jgi:myo-inositol-1(or 4)-monophosphatase
LAGEPDSIIVGEEEGQSGSGAVRWYVDPIDGTANFVHGLPFFCTSVAATVDGRVVAAAVYDPLREDLFTASPAGAWRNGSHLTSTGATAETAALLLSGYPSARHLAEDRDRALDRLDTLVRTYATVRRVGSTVLALAYVAAGWADVAVGLSVNPWDLAAGSLLVTRAGGHFAGLRRDEGTEPAWHGPGYVAATGSLPQPSTVYSVFTDTHRVVQG